MSDSLRPAPVTHRLRVGESVTLTGRGLDQNGFPLPLPSPAEWSAKAEGAVSVVTWPDGSGRVTAVTPGTATVALNAGGLLAVYWFAVFPETPLDALEIVAGTA